MVAVGWIALELLGTILVVLAGVYIYYKYVIFDFWRKKGVVHMEPSVPVGNLAPIILGKMSIGEVFEQAYVKYKDRPFFGMYTFFKPNLVVVDPDLVRFVLAKEFASFHDRGIHCNEKTDPLSGHLFLLPGKKWRNLRVRLTPTFTTGKIKQMFETIKDSGESLSKFLETKAQRRETVELKDIFARYATDIIMSIAFGINCNSLEDPDNEFRYWGKKVFEPQPFWNAIVMFAPQFLDFFSLPYTHRGVTKFFMKVFNDVVDYRQTKNIVRRDFMNLLIQLIRDGYVEADEERESIDNENIKNNTSNKLETTKLTLPEGAAQAYVFYLAGFETSSTTITHCLYELALHQDIQDKVYEEINANLQKNGGLTYDGLHEMSYLHKVVSETMRKYPALPILNRICTKDIDLPNSNIRIPEGTLVVVPVLGLHRDPRIYPDPDKFDPERFTEANIAARHPYVYLPFGEGPRICIGSRFGLVQTKIGLISALSKFRLKLGPNTPIPLKFDVGSIVLTPQDPIHLIIESR